MAPKTNNVKNKCKGISPQEQIWTQNIMVLSMSIPKIMNIIIMNEPGFSAIRIGIEKTQIKKTAKVSLFLAMYLLKFF